MLVRLLAVVSFGRVSLVSSSTLNKAPVELLEVDSRGGQFALTHVTFFPCGGGLGWVTKIESSRD